VSDHGRVAKKFRALVIARGIAAEVLEPSEAALYDVAFFIRLFVMPDALLAIGFFLRKARNASVS
jgi:hypothetical protein